MYTSYADKSYSTSGKAWEKDGWRDRGRVSRDWTLYILSNFSFSIENIFIFYTEYIFIENIFIFF